MSKQQGKWTLALERSSRPPTMALFFGNDCVCEREFPPMAAHGSTAWAGALRDILEENGIAAGELSLLVAGLGPGSFSGARSAIAFLHGLAMPDSIPLVGVCSAAAAAFAEARKNGAPRIVAVAGNARRNTWWRAVYETAYASDAPFGAALRVLKNGAPRPPANNASDFDLVAPDEESLRAGVPEGARWLEVEPLAAPALAPSPTVPTARQAGELALSDLAAAVSAPVPIYLHPAVMAPAR